MAEDLAADAERVTAMDAGLPRGAELPFHFKPSTHWSPLVISSPHVGLAWPAGLAPRPQVNFARNADLEVHTLYREFDAAMLYARYSRLVVDLNRAPDDVSPDLVPDHPSPRPRKHPGLQPGQANPGAAGYGNRGVVWRNAVGNITLFTGPLSYARFRERIQRFHAPYYAALETLLERRRRRFGYAILLDAHSMPSSVGPHLVVGTLHGRSCDPFFRDCALNALHTPTRPRERTLEVRADDPYAGGEVVRHFGRPQAGVHALQLEISRGLYMDERRLVMFEDQRARRDRGRGRGAEQVAALRSRLETLVSSLSVVRSLPSVAAE